MTETLEPRQAYGLWAPTYEEDGALATLDELARLRLDPSPRTPLLDAACGTGRRIRSGEGARLPGTFGIDLVLEMLAAGRPRIPAVAVADLRGLPFRGQTFRTAWCRLAIGHVAEVGDVYGELGRVLSPGGRLLVTDFHPDASRNGMRRTFRVGEKRWAVAHHVHEIGEHRDAAARNALSLDSVLEIRVGEELRAFYEAAGAMGRFEREKGRPVLLALSFLRG